MSSPPRSSRSRLSPAAWLLATTVAVVLAFIGATLYTSHVAGGIDSLATDISDTADPSIRYLGAAWTELHGLADALTTTLLDGHHAPALRQELLKREQHVRDDLEAYARLRFFPTERGRWRIVEIDVQEVESRADAVLAKLEAGDANGAVELRAGPLDVALRRADTDLGNLIEFDADQGSRLSAEIRGERVRAQRTACVLDGLAVLLAVAMLGAGATATRQYVRALRQARDAEAAMTDRLRGVARAALSITEALARSEKVNDVLETTVNVARSVAGADLAALGVGTDPSRPFDPFVYAGVEPSMMDLLGAPHPRGMLAAGLRERRTVRVDDVAKDGRFGGFPSRHPPIGPFLGVPLHRDDEAVGHLYLARSPGAPPFSEQDAHTVELLGEFAASAIQNARLYAALHREVTAREDLLSIVSHDLRGPLSATSMAAALWLRRPATDDKARRQVTLIARNAERMDRMIGDLLTAAKVHEGRLSVEPTVQRARALLADAVEQFSAQASSKGVALRAEVPGEALAVYCDGARIGQVLSNLIGNALKFTDAGGSIVVSAKRSEGSPGEVCFSVRDTGVGIAPAWLPRVFERYWQKPEHGSRGTGLGLYIAKGIVESHHGRIWVTSRLGEGSDFQFTLPAEDAYGDDETLATTSDA